MGVLLGSEAGAAYAATIYCGGGTCNGTSNPDTMYGTGGTDYISGNGGADTINADSGDDSLYGNNGDDNLSAGYGNDVLNGAAGADSLNAGPGADSLDGGTNNSTYGDILAGDPGNDQLYSHLDFGAPDGLFGRQDSDQCFVGTNDVVDNCEAIFYYSPCG